MSTKVLQFRRYGTAQMNTITGFIGEFMMDTDKKTIVVHDEVTVGGIPLAREDEVAARHASAMQQAINMAIALGG